MMAQQPNQDKTTTPPRGNTAILNDFFAGMRIDIVPSVITQRGRAILYVHPDDLSEDLNGKME